MTLGIGVKIIETKNHYSALRELSKDNTKLAAVLFPGKQSGQDWWIKYSLKGLFIISCSPILYKMNEKQIPKILILSKNKPNTVDTDISLYITLNKQPLKTNLSLQCKIDNKYLYMGIGKPIINEKNINYIGSYPQPISY